MDGKKAILVVSFGTSYLDTLEKTIGAIARRIAGAYPDYKVYRAFTSQMIINKLKRTENLQVDTVGEALKRMAAEGIERVIVQPTHVINGIENDRMMEDLMEYMDKFRKISVGKPMLSSVDDYKKAIHAVMAQTELKEEEMLVLMGHGTDHHANAAYPTLEYTFHALGYQQVLVGTVVAGDHAQNDMAGEEDSWMSALTEDGYEVRAAVRGLGEMEGIQNLFLEHIEEVL